MNFNYDIIREKFGEEAVSAAKELNSMYTEAMYEWIASMWDGETGAFYYSTSARDNAEFFPDSESTTQSIGLLHTLGLTADEIKSLPEGFREKVGKYAYEMQDEDGYFYHHVWGKDISPSRRGRNLGQCSWLVKSVWGKETKYPTAIENLKSNSEEKAVDKEAIPEHLRSEAAFRKYLDELDLNTKSYPKGHYLSSQAGEIIAAGFRDICVDYIKSKQNLENGTWENEVNYSSISGVTKVGAALFAFNEPIPNATLAFRSALRVAMEDSYCGSITDIFNPIGTMEQMLNDFKKMGMNEDYESAKKLLTDNAAEFIAITAKKLRPFYRAHEGAFSYCPGCSSSWSQGKVVCLGLDEADVNATSLSVGTRRRVFDMLGLSMGKPFDESDGKRFFEMIGEN